MVQPLNLLTSFNLQFLDLWISVGNLKQGSAAKAVLNNLAIDHSRCLPCGYQKKRSWVDRLLNHDCLARLVRTPANARTYCFNKALNTSTGKIELLLHLLAYMAYQYHKL